MIWTQHQAYLGVSWGSDQKLPPFTTASTENVGHVPLVLHTFRNCISRPLLGYNTLLLREGGFK